MTITEKKVNLSATISSSILNKLPRISKQTVLFHNRAAREPIRNGESDLQE
jgi:hypothetical protein